MDTFIFFDLNNFAINVGDEVKCSNVSGTISKIYYSHDVAICESLNEDNGISHSCELKLNNGDIGDDASYFDPLFVEFKKKN